MVVKIKFVVGESNVEKGKEDEIRSNCFKVYVQDYRQHQIFSSFCSLFFGKFGEDVVL